MLVQPRLDTVTGTYGDGSMIGGPRFPTPANSEPGAAAGAAGSASVAADEGAAAATGWGAAVVAAPGVRAATNETERFNFTSSLVSMSFLAPLLLVPSDYKQSPGQSAEPATLTFETPGVVPF